MNEHPSAWRLPACTSCGLHDATDWHDGRTCCYTRTAATARCGECIAYSPGSHLTVRAHAWWSHGDGDDGVGCGTECKGIAVIFEQCDLTANRQA